MGVSLTLIDRGGALLDDLITKGCPFSRVCNFEVALLHLNLLDSVVLVKVYAAVILVLLLELCFHLKATRLAKTTIRPCADEEIASTS